MIDPSFRSPTQFVPTYSVERSHYFISRFLTFIHEQSFSIDAFVVNPSFLNYSSDLPLIFSNFVSPNKDVSVSPLISSSSLTSNSKSSIPMFIKNFSSSVLSLSLKSASIINSIFIPILDRLVDPNFLFDSLLFKLLSTLYGVSSFSDFFGKLEKQYSNIFTLLPTIPDFVNKNKNNKNNLSIPNPSTPFHFVSNFILNNPSFLRDYPSFSFIHSSYNHDFNTVLPTILHDSDSKLFNHNLPATAWRYTFNGVRRALRFLKTPDDILSWYIKVAKISDKILILLDLPTNVVIPFLSSVKTVLHNNCDFIHRGWAHYLDLSVMAGYPTMDNREKADDPTLWLSTPTVSEYDQDWWFVQFQQTYFSNQPTSIRLLTYKEFVLNRWLWVTNGATRFSSALLDDEQVKTKFGAAISLSDSELLKHAFLEHDDSNKIGVFLKPDEPGYKRRLIANVSLGPYLVAAYIRYYIEKTIGKTPNFVTLDVLIDDKIDIVGLIQTGHTMVPLDESAYDYHVSRESWLGFHQFLASLDPNNIAFKLFFQYFNEATWSFEGKDGHWLSGMPSGLALTSFVNSWMNYIKQKHIIPSIWHKAAGDDVLAPPLLNGVNLEAVALEYEKFGSSVNATKNWVSQRYAEYLKVLYDNQSSTGYAARVFSSLIWAGKERSFLPSDRLPELSELFKQFYDRLGVPFDEYTVARDLSASISSKTPNFSISLAKKWLHSPRAYGGFGLLPYNNVVFQWEAKVLKKRKYTNVIIQIPDVNFYDTEVKLTTFERKLHANRRWHCGYPLRLPTPVTLEQWERRLNGDDIPIKGKFGRASLDVIPLPTLNGISTGTMSAFARQLNFHVLPNIRGDSSTIVDALVLASMDLVTRVQKYCIEHNISYLAN